MRSRNLFCVFLFVTTLMIPCWPDRASAGFGRQVIWNDTGAQADGLHLEFVGAVEQVDFEPFAEGGSAATGILSDGGTVADFPPRSIGLIASGLGGAIDFETAPVTSAHLAPTDRSVWESDDNVLGPVTFFGAPPRIAVGPSGWAATFFNPMGFSVTYSDIALYAGNAIANYNIEEFFRPTGDLVPDLPTSITLEAGESQTLEFGPVSGLGYQLAVARAGATDNPDVSFVVASAEAVPEPGALTLLGLGAGGLVLVARRGRSPGAAHVDAGP